MNLKKFLKAWKQEDQVEADHTGVFKFLGKNFSLEKGQVLKADINFSLFAKECDCGENCCSCRDCKCR